ncbi:BrnA antitoxin family protein [Rhodococcus cerastii]|nr:BrnA antitoxin family protein [Rhodococcus cerastii]
MDPTTLAELRDYYDNTDTSALIEESTLDETVDPAPMVGITVRLPAAVLNKVREQAGERGIKTTALIREWIESCVADHTDDDSTVKFSDVKKLFAHARPRATDQRGVPEGATEVIVGDYPTSLSAAQIPRGLITVVDGSVTQLESLEGLASDVDVLVSGRSRWPRAITADRHLSSSPERSTRRKQ